jgi:hypothetical protein
MNLVGKEIRNKVYGLGTVTNQDDQFIYVDFAAKSCKFSYPHPDTFVKLLRAEDPDVHAAILAEMEAEREAEAARKREVEEARLRALEEAARQEAECRSAGKGSKEKPFVRQERIPGKGMTFYVFQGGTFEHESSGGYIWAPIANRAGGTCHHWDRLLDVRPGDIILHGCDAHMQAISVAQGECYEAKQPEALRTEDMWEQDGRRVDCEYEIIERPIKTSDYTEEILRHCAVKYAPFDKDGNGNMGYLYEIDRDLARVFVRASAEKNPELLEIDYISDFLAEKE